MGNSLTWTSILISSFYDSGVKQAIISPGSRSTPLTLAAAIHPGIQKKVVLDERSAAFIALGIGKSTGIPAILICTSGTALANYFPAVIEAKESGTPMVILSADRPPNLRNLGSSQTIDQLKIFGNQTVFFHEAGEPAEYEQDSKRIAYAAKQAVEFSINRGGAAHINLPFRKPLEPESDFFMREEKRLSEQSTDQTFKPAVNASEITPDENISNLVSSSERPLLIAGPSNPHQALNTQAKEMAELFRAPLLAEPASQLGKLEQSITTFDQFLRNPEIRQQLQPDLIVRFGDQPFSTVLLRIVENWREIPVIHITSRSKTQDQAMNITYKILCKKQDSLNFAGLQPNTEKNWLQGWKKHEDEAQKKLWIKLNSVEALTDGHVFHHFSKQASDNWNMMLSNSLPVRDMLTFGHSRENQFVNRGAAGIDGIISTALGIHFSSDHPTCCLIGDLAFLHDSNSLYSLQQVKDRPFVVVVINNQGGNIFRMLPIYRDQNKSVPNKYYRTYFETSQKTDIRFLAKASDIRYQKIDSLSKLKEVDLDNGSGAIIIECITDPDTSMNLRTELLTS